MQTLRRRKVFVCFKELRHRKSFHNGPSGCETFMCKRGSISLP